MTAAGVATLFITQDYASTENSGNCKGGVRNEFIERGLSYMDNHIEEAISGNLYTLYGIERIGGCQRAKILRQPKGLVQAWRRITW